MRAFLPGPFLPVFGGPRLLVLRTQESTGQKADRQRSEGRPELWVRHLAPPSLCSCLRHDGLTQICPALIPFDRRFACPQPSVAYICDLASFGAPCIAFAPRGKSGRSVTHRVAKHASSCAAGRSEPHLPFDTHIHLLSPFHPQQLDLSTHLLALFFSPTTALSHVHRHAHTRHGPLLELNTKTVRPPQADEPTSRAQPDLLCRP